MLVKHDRQQKGFCSLRLCGIASLRSLTQFNAKAQRREGIINPRPHVLYAVAHPADQLTVLMSFRDDYTRGFLPVVQDRFSHGDISRIFTPQPSP